MAGLREIKRRMKAVKSTAQVTRAMQLVAASKMKRAQQQALANRPYAAGLMALLQQMPAQARAEVPLLADRTCRRRGIIVITPDKGLCGSLLTNLSRELLRLPQEALYVAVGRKGAALLARQRRELTGEFHLNDRVHFSQLRPACQLMISAYEQGQIDTIEVFYAQYLSPILQRPTLQPLLPLPTHKLDGSSPTEETRPFILEPSASELLAALLPQYLKQELYHMALEAKASEHSARMVAMKNATDNAKALAGELTLTYNKARQAAITQEILELAAASSI
jgi:F-type H+-transporting ATPase subunit gamma